MLLGIPGPAPDSSGHCCGRQEVLAGAQLCGHSALSKAEAKVHELFQQELNKPLRSACSSGLAATAGHR